MIDEKDIKVGLKFRLTKIDTQYYEKFCLQERLTPGIVCLDLEVVDKGKLECECKVIGADADTVFVLMRDIIEKGEKLPAAKDECSRIKEEAEQVSHPSHYAWLKDLCGVEPIDICRHFDFAVGNALKYLMRKGKVERSLTEKEQRIQDLAKAIYYINSEIDLIRNDSNNKNEK